VSHSIRNSALSSSIQLSSIADKFQRRFQSTAETVAVADVATYIHRQINGTFHTIHKDLFELVDILGYANDGSITRVRMDDARIMIEDIGACPEGLETHLEENRDVEKAVSLWKELEQETDAGPDPATFLTTDELIDKYTDHPLGIYLQFTSTGVIFNAKEGPLPRSMMARPAVLTGRHALKYQKKNPVSRKLNIWCFEHERPGWRKCGWQCKKWYLEEEGCECSQR